MSGILPSKQAWGRISRTVRAVDSLVQTGGIQTNKRTKSDPPLLFDLRIVDRGTGPSAAQEVQLYAPEDMPLMYTNEDDYFLTAPTRDTEEPEWVSLKGIVALGASAYAYHDVANTCVVIANAAPAPVNGVTPPYLLVGSTELVQGSEYAVVQAWNGHFNINTAEALHIWQIRDIDGVTCIYMPANSFVVNGKDFTALQTGLTAIGITSPDWYSVASFSTTGLNAYITFSNDVFTNMTGKPITLAFGTMSPDPLVYKYVEIPILVYTATQGLYSLHHSAINYERTSFDGDLPSPKFRSIAKPYDNGDWDDEDHTVGAYGFMTPLTPDEAPFAGTPTRTQHISLRETNSAGDGAELRWYDLRTLISDLKTDLVTDIAFLSDLGDALGPYIPWNSDWDDKLKHTTLGFGDSTSAKGEGLSGGNTDHDDSYWHEAGTDFGSLFIDTKNYCTSGDVRAREFALQGANATNYWNSTVFTVKTSTIASFDGSGTANLSLGVDSSTGSFLNIYFNGVAGVDITNWTTKGGLTGATIQEISIEDAQPSDKILVIRS